MAYRFFTDATADFPLESCKGFPKVEIIPMQVEINDQEYTYGPYGSLPVEVFYNFQRMGKFGTTSQISPSIYRAYFEHSLKKGEDVLYLCFSSGLSGTFQAANMCIAELKEYCMYFPLSKLQVWGKRFADQPQTIYSAFPTGEIALMLL